MDADPAAYTGPAWESGAIILASLSLVATLVAIPPFCWHVRHRNMAAASLMFWPIILCSFNSVNALIWHNDDVTHWWRGNGLCDVEVKITTGSYAGFVCALLTIIRSLANVLDTRRICTQTTKQHRFRENLLQWTMCWGCPVYLMIVHYFVQPYRYYIWGISGCSPAFDNSWPSIALVFVWPLVFSIANVVYAGILIYRLHRYRHDFSHMLRSNQTSKSRFVRLFALSLILILCFLPLSAFVFYSNLSYTLHPYSWDDVHQGTWTEIYMIPSQGAVIYDRWFRIAAAFLSFVFFGMGEDAMNMYKRWMAQLGLTKWFPSINDRRPSLPTGTTGTDVSTIQTDLSATSTKKQWYSVILSKVSRSEQQTLPLNTAHRTSLSSIQAGLPSPLDKKKPSGPMNDCVFVGMPHRAITALEQGVVVVRHEMWEENGPALIPKPHF